MTIAPIALHEVLADIETAPSFRIRYVECDVNRKTGGRVVERLACKLKNSAPKADSVTTGKKGQLVEKKDKDSSDPYAFHIRDINSGDIKGVHARLIIGYNDKPVRY